MKLTPGQILYHQTAPTSFSEIQNITANIKDNEERQQKTRDMYAMLVRKVKPQCKASRKK